MRMLSKVAVAGGLILLGACSATSSVARPEAFPASRPVAALPSHAAATATNESASAPAHVPEAAKLTIAPATIAVLETALGLLGTKYRFGGVSPETGFDCSGYVSYVLRQHGVEIPRIVADQFGAGRSVAQNEIQAGDLVFFTTTGPGATHVGLVVSTGARWEFIHAPADGSSVRVERFDTGYWQQLWVGARRVLG